MDGIHNKRSFPRDVVISTGYGAGLSSWWQGSTIDGYDLIESPILIKACRENKSWDEVAEMLIAAGFDYNAVEDLYPGGWVDAVVVSVSGPYRVVEYDGAESIEERDNVKWRE